MKIAGCDIIPRPTKKIEIPIEDDDFDFPMLSSVEYPTENDQVTVGDITVKCGNVYRAAKIACILVAFNERDLTYEESMKKIDDIKPRLF